MPAGQRVPRGRLTAESADRRSRRRDGWKSEIDSHDKPSPDASSTGAALFVASGGGGDMIAADILCRKLTDAGVRGHIATYSWERLLIDPVPGPRGANGFTGLRPFGAHNHIVTGRTVATATGYSLLPRVALELRREFFLLDPHGGACGLRRQLSELVDALSIGRVHLVDSGGDILARGDERELRSPLADSLSLAASDDLDVPVDVLIAGAGLDGELTPDYVRHTVEEVGGDVDWCALGAVDVHRHAPLLAWHPSEVNGLLVAAARGFRGTVEIRDAPLFVAVDDRSAAVHRCSREGLLTRNQLAKAMIESRSLAEAEDSFRHHRDTSELDYQRRHRRRYDGRRAVTDIDARIRRLVDYSATRPPHVAALSLRRAAEVMEVGVRELPQITSALQRAHPGRLDPPLWWLRRPHAASS